MPQLIKINVVINKSSKQGPQTEKKTLTTHLVKTTYWMTRELHEIKAGVASLTGDEVVTVGLVFQLAGFATE